VHRAEFVRADLEPPHQTGHIALFSATTDNSKAIVTISTIYCTSKSSCIAQCMRRYCEVQRFVGYLKQLTVDDKGFVAVIGFGVPPHAHDNDPVRGLQCAMVGSNCVNMRTFNLVYALFILLL